MKLLYAFTLSIP